MHLVEVSPGRIEVEPVRVFGDGRQFIGDEDGGENGDVDENEEYSRRKSSIGQDSGDFVGNFHRCDGARCWRL